MCNWDTALVLFFSSKLISASSLPLSPVSISQSVASLFPCLHSLPPPSSLVLTGPHFPPAPWVMLWNQVRMVKTAVGLCTVAREGGVGERDGMERGWLLYRMGLCWAFVLVTSHTTPNGWLARLGSHTDHNMGVGGFLRLKVWLEKFPSGKAPITPGHRGTKQNDNGSVVL